MWERFGRDRKISFRQLIIKFEVPSFETNTITMSHVRDYTNTVDSALVESANDSEGTADTKHEERKRRRRIQKECEAREKAEREEREACERAEREEEERRATETREEKVKGKVSIIPT